MGQGIEVTAVIWDFDGTLADTLQRNLEITRRIVERLTGGTAERFPALKDRDRYASAVHSAASWRQLYVDHFGLPPERTAEAAPLWTEFHQDDRSIPPLFDGVAEVVLALTDRRQGIVSQNSRANIEHSLEPAQLLGLFEHIVADEDLPFERQKPEPDGLLHCAEVLHNGFDLAPTHVVLYIGDHPVDIECVRRATHRLGEEGQDWRLASVGVEYGGGRANWPTPPDYRASHAADILDIVRRLEAT